MTTTPTPMNDRNVAFFTISRKDAAALIRDLASALAEPDSIDMELEFRTTRTADTFHEISLGLRNMLSTTSGLITDSATWE